MASTTSTMQFMAPMEGEPFYRSQPDKGFEQCSFKYEPQEVQIRDARPQKESFQLDTHAFTFADDEAGAKFVEDLRNNGDGAKERYYTHLESFLKKQTGCSRVVIFDHTMRRRDPALAGRNPDGREQPAAYVHVDQGPIGANRRVHQHLGYEADAILKNRVQIVNVWRPLNGPVHDWPLATMDYTSLKPEHYHPTNLYRNRFEIRGQSCNISHDKAQRWYYLNEQKNTEVTLIKIWDNKVAVTGKTCAHCAFQHSETPKDAPLRESMEVRCILIYDDEPVEHSQWWV